jgi:hypothetical protein
MRRKATGSEAGKALTFAWRIANGDTARMTLAFLLASGLALVLGVTLRIQVPSRMAADSPFFSAVELVTLDEQNAPALQSLLEKGRVPTLGDRALVLEAPRVDDFLARFGLLEEASPELVLYAAPSLEEEPRWPDVLTGEGKGLTLPAVAEVELDRPELPTEAEGWFLRLTAPEGWREAFPEGRIPWQGELPLELASEMTVVLALDGGVALAFLDDSVEPEIARKLRREVERWISRHEDKKLPAARNATLKVELSFETEPSSP